MKVENWLEKRNKDIELRSEEVQEVMGQVPAWIVRWGIRLLFLVVVTLLVGSCFFKYPDVITADMTLTGQHPATAGCQPAGLSDAHRDPVYFPGYL